MVQAKEYLGKHYTNTEKTGLTATEQKTKKILHDLYFYFCDNKTRNTDEMLKQGKTDVTITLYDLNLLEAKALNPETSVVNRHTLSSWRRGLLNQGFLIQNPTSHIIHTGINKCTPIIMPNNNTRYYINFSLIAEKLKASIEREKMDTHTTQQPITIDSFIKSEENHVSSEHQETNMSKSEIDEKESEKVLSNLQKRIN
jgi:hypothetical protein